jgi:signal transduction histidine kinase/DNA-binding response OmpR family regulator
MEAPKLPPDEAARLAELHLLQVLDTPAEARFDRITELAQRLFHVPIVFVSLVDANRQWFKSRQGCDARETSREISFCGHAILQENVFLVPNALEDERFCDNPLVVGEPFIRFYAGFPLSGPTGMRIGTLCIIDQVPRQLDQSQLLNLRDIGHWVETELAARLVEETASRMQREFISTVSHELRTPLTSIRGSLGLLVSGAVGVVPERAQPLLRIAKNNCERLVLLINDLLDSEKIDSGNMRFDMVMQPLQPLIQQALSMTQAFADQYQVSLRSDCSDTPVWVTVDSDRMLQVLINLISNACKFSSPGAEVLIQMQVQDDNRTRVAVIDRGPGIPVAFRSRIFQKFSQADSSDTRVKGGTGLGLSISQALIQHMHGEIGFISEVGQGSEFFFVLPFQMMGRHLEATDASILICEDDPDVAKLIKIMLAEGGWQCDIAYTAASARQLLQTEQYQAVTLDLGLPGEDGVSLLQWMRSQPGLVDLPVVVVSAHLESTQTGLSGAAFGVVDLLPKPIDAHRLMAAVQSAMFLDADVAEGASILHVDDDPEFLQLVSHLLAPRFLTVSAANLQQAREKLTQQRFQLILLDLHLPDGNGADLLGDLPEPNRFTPVVIFSARDIDGKLLQKVCGSLVKSRISNEDLSAILHDFMRHRYHRKLIGKKP